MIPRLAELNRVLAAVEWLGGGTPVHSAGIVEYCSQQVIEGRLPNHEQTIEFAVRLRMLNFAEEGVMMTDDGSSFLSLNPTRIFDLTDEQRLVLGRAYYLGRHFADECRALFSAFSFSSILQTYRWSDVDSPALEAPGWLLTNLIEIGLLHPIAGGFQVAARFSILVASFLEEEKGMSEARLQEILREKEEVGFLAESLMRQYECDRLASGGHGVESNCVRSIGRVRVNAGYDLESFDGASPSLVYDRFIEVKGAKGRDLRFFWSENEIKVAQRLGGKYWVYFQGGISPQKGTASVAPVLIQDPIKNVLNNAAYETIPQGLIVTLKRTT